ncbi:hypothetical protein DFH27DRAFT_135297 [Peziza echinospora]|nr:hypothetical protein DFH27DRAFT_135297 [Peziza echinospora]
MLAGADNKRVAYASCIDDDGGGLIYIKTVPVRTVVVVVVLPCLPPPRPQPSSPLLLCYHRTHHSHSPTPSLLAHPPHPTHITITALTHRTPNHPPPAPPPPASALTPTIPLPSTPLHLPPPASPKPSFLFPLFFQAFESIALALQRTTPHLTALCSCCTTRARPTLARLSTHQHQPSHAFSNSHAKLQSGWRTLGRRSRLPQQRHRTIYIDDNSSSNSRT